MSVDISSMKIREIEKLIKNGKVDIANELAEDPRSGVQKLYNKLIKEKQEKTKELQRLENLSIYESELRLQGHGLIAGVDEAGRGPLAGPVFAGAVMFPEKVEIININDSKKLSSKKREQLAIRIKELAISWSIGVATEEEIYDLNIRKATHLAMLRAVTNLTIQPSVLIIDGFIVPGANIAQKAIKGGDAKSVSIAAASILAKVERDKVMRRYHEQYPQYGFDKHKGYGTKEHFSAIMKYGSCPIHRRDFEPIKSFIENQNSLFKDYA